MSIDSFPALVARSDNGALHVALDTVDSSLLPKAMCWFASPIPRLTIKTPWALAARKNFPHLSHHSRH